LKFVKIGGIQQFHVNGKQQKTTKKTALMLYFQSYFDMFTRQQTFKKKTILGFDLGM